MIPYVIEVDKQNTIRDIYKLVAQKLFSLDFIKNKTELYEDLIARDELGSVKIYDDVNLPHIISNNIKEDVVVRVDGYKENVLFILIKEDTIEIKERVMEIIKLLLDDNTRFSLFNTSKRNFKKTINSI